MSGESNSDVYRSFGVNPVVVTSDSNLEHEQNMLALNVRCRDNDDSIELAEEQNDETNELSESQSEQSDIDEDYQGEQEEVEEQSLEDDSEAMEYEPLGEATDELKETIGILENHEKGFEQAVNQAAAAGLSEDIITRIQQEYNDADELSEQSFKDLESVGYSREFVQSYIRGQEALVNQYVNEIKQYAGGADRFDSLYSHLEATNPTAADSLITAIQNRDIGTIQTIINLASTSRSKKFGKTATRSIASTAKQATPAPKKQVGFNNKAEMMKAMSDPRYRTDPDYRAQVEQKVYCSNF